MASRLSPIHSSDHGFVVEWQTRGCGQLRDGRSVVARAADHVPHGAEALDSDNARRVDGGSRIVSGDVDEVQKAGEKNIEIC